MAKFLQPSLSGGELSPGMRGRVDLARYPVSLGKARNFITKPTGGGAKRPGTVFRGRVKFSNKMTRLVAFIYSTSVKYLLEMGDGYIRFWVDGVLLTNSQKQITGISTSNPTLVTSPSHGFSNGDQVVVSGVRGMTKVNNRTYTVINASTNTFQLQGFNGSMLDPYTGGGVVGRIVEVATPYINGMIADVRFTQSADVLYMVHGDVPPKELRRISAEQFEIRDFPFKRGPFRPANSNDAFVMAASAATGQITLNCNTDVFSVNMIGSLVYLEEQELRGVKPWASAEKNVPVGQLRRRDGKIYRAVSVPTNIGSEGTPYWVTGAQAPVHDSGRAFDGPQDVKSDGVNSYGVGVEWEFLHNVFGTMRIDSFINSKQVTGTVIERLPDSITGVVPTPSNTWNLTGNGVLKDFAIAGATATTNASYTVTIAGVPVQANPNYGPGDPNDEWCVASDSFLIDGRRALDVSPGDLLACYDSNAASPGINMLYVQANSSAMSECVRLVTASGASIVDARRCCVASDSFLIDGRRALDVSPGDLLACYDSNAASPGINMLYVQANSSAMSECVRLVTASGASIVASVTTPMTLRDGSCVNITDMQGLDALVCRDNKLAWEAVEVVEAVGVRQVSKISVRDQCYFAGETTAAFIATHNIEYQKR